jgi:hypothetical protein
VPYMAVSLLTQKRDPEQSFYQEEDLWYIRPDQIYEAFTIIEFMNKRLMTEVELQLPFQTVFIRNVIFFAIVLAVLLVIKHSYSILIKPMTWYIIAMLVFFICTGGVIHTIIH